MSHLVPGPPKPVKQPPAKVISIVSPKVKLFLVLIGLLIYVYLLIFVKTMFTKNKRMDRMDIMAMEAQQMIHQVHTVDQNMAINMERIDDIYGDY